MQKLTFWTTSSYSPISVALTKADCTNSVNKEKFIKDQVVYKEGAKANKLYCIIEGTFEAYKTIKIRTANGQTSVSFKSFMDSSTTRTHNLTEIPKNITEQCPLSIFSNYTTFGGNEIAFGASTRYCGFKCISQFGKVLALTTQDLLHIKSPTLNQILLTNAERQTLNQQQCVDDYVMNLKFKKPEVMNKQPSRLKFSPKAVKNALNRVNTQRENIFLDTLKSQRILTEEISK